MEEQKTYRDRSSSDTRCIELRHTIDPGFVNRRLVQSIIGQNGMVHVDNLIGRIPPLPDGLFEARIDHAYNQVLSVFCEAVNAKTLGALLASGNGHLFCSTEQFEPCPDVYDSPRVQSVIAPHGNTDYTVILEYSTAHVRSDTLRMELHRGDLIAVAAHFDRKEGNTLYFRPLIMGGPWMSHEDTKIADWAMWENFEHFENFIEDFKEFEAVRQSPKPQSCEPMRSVSESAFKTCLAELLGDATRSDWGGEMSDHFTSQLHLGDKRVTGAFLLKGPARFAPMTLNHLGKNNDQIFRLAQEPADVLFVQHCHDVETAVRATLRAFAVQPGRPRRYCIIDGRDSLWILEAYRLYDKAVRLTTNDPSCR